MNPHHPLQRLLRASVFAAAGFAALAQAQTGGVVLRGQDLQEDALIQALLPPLPEGMGSRTIRPVSAAPSRPAASTAAAPARANPLKAPSASVLVTFDTNSAELTDEAKRQLDVVARALNNEQLFNLSFAIEGHADPRGTSDENLRLSQARADNVRDYLVRVGQVGPERLQALGKGDREPLNAREVAAPENRRVTFVTRAQ